MSKLIVFKIGKSPVCLITLQKLSDMKKIMFFLLTLAIAICFIKCNHTPSVESNKNNPDSVKKTILALSDSIFHSVRNPEKFQTYCEDSLLVVGDGYYLTSSKAFSKDLYSLCLVPPHDFTFRLYDNTAILSNVSTWYEMFNGDTVYFSMRNLRTFVFSNGKWKLVANAFGREPVNYFKPVTDKKNYASYAGVYKVNTGNLDTIIVKDGKLYDKQAGLDKLEFPINDSEYMTAGNLDRFVFAKNSEGNIESYAEIGYDGQKTIAPKIK